MKFLIGEYVERLADGEVGVVKSFDGEAYRVEMLGRVVLGSESAWDHHHRIHAHITVDSADCDGSYERSHTFSLTAEERAEEFVDFHFKERVAGDVISFHAYGTLTVTPEGLAWDETTDEGYVHTAVEWCEDDCDLAKRTYRDHRAESMGY